MNSLNIYELTRIIEGDRFSSFEQALSARTYKKNFNEHEIESLRALVDELTSEKLSGGPLTLSQLEGFFFSYTIDHISKEFDLLKVTEDGSCILNIELKSESIEEERIKAQLVQNRYYLGHITKRIHSFTYISETKTLYTLSTRGRLHKSTIEEMAALMRKNMWAHHLQAHIGGLFKESDYLISPLHTPERFLSGEYFLTNQQAEFKRQVLEHISSEENSSRDIIGISGASGTGKTLLLYDLAKELSAHRHLVIIHCGPLCEGHRIIDQRWKNAEIYSMPGIQQQMETGVTDLSFIHDCDVLMIDEANHITPAFYYALEEELRGTERPYLCFYSYNPEQTVQMEQDMKQLDDHIRKIESMHCELSGNIRINRRIASFVRELLHTTDVPSQKDYRCIEILYADSSEEYDFLCRYGLELGFENLQLTPDMLGIVGHEFDNVQVTLDQTFYYDHRGYLCSCLTPSSVELAAELISRARKKLRIIVDQNPVLFDRLLLIKN